MEEKQGKYKFGMVIDLDKCTGCGTCMVACASENNVSVRTDESDKERSIAWMELFKITNGKPFPQTEVSYFPRPCMHCHHKTPCVSVCPPTATQMDYETGIVSQIYTRCIGCRYCQASCPYEARVFNWWKPRYEGSFKNSLNPEVSIASRGTVVKCTFCSHIWKRERDKAVAAGELDINAVTYTPACVAACPTKAMVFGDLNDPNSELNQLLKKEKGREFRLVHPIDEKDEKTQEKMKSVKNFPNPKVYYLTSKQWIKDMQKFK